MFYRLLLLATFGVVMTIALPAEETKLPEDWYLQRPVHTDVQHSGGLIDFFLKLIGGPFLWFYNRPFGQSQQQ